VRRRCTSSVVEPGPSHHSRMPPQQGVFPTRMTLTLFKNKEVGAKKGACLLQLRTRMLAPRRRHTRVAWTDQADGLCRISAAGTCADVNRADSLLRPSAEVAVVNSCRSPARRGNGDPACCADDHTLPTRATLQATTC
jgi:hypothetical protein